ncbi:sensor histidine kinase [Nitriliruptor alkaliphilus]|uniref:sensor histidine kinase n=1 Tax=Nitriliruptor alkaliphilus TaxID=427918 RepID=UPI0006978C43|nr:sensor histidine kinase [Nitriliruptor alkaliphilus]
MVIDAVRSLWTEPRAPDPSPRWWWRDRLLAGVLILVALVEGVFREDLPWRPFTVAIGVALLLLLPMRRTRPLLVVLVVFGVVTVVDTVSVAAGVDPEQTTLWTTAWVLVLPYSLARWGSGREITIGSAIVVLFPLLTHARNGLGDTLLGLLFFALSVTLGAAARYRATSQVRALEQVRSREREQLARELHDTVAHHVSAIAIQAQAGRTLAAEHPGRAAEALANIEEAASRTLAEMRAMVGVLRAGEEPDLAPQPGLADIEGLAQRSGDAPRVDVELQGDLDDLGPGLATALYRLAQESVTNALRHARHATCIQVQITGDREHVRLTVHDDGQTSAADRITEGYGIVGMTERATLLGGTLEVGPTPGSGWSVVAQLPRTGAAT